MSKRQRESMYELKLSTLFRDREHAERLYCEYQTQYVFQTIRTEDYFAKAQIPFTLANALPSDKTLPSDTLKFLLRYVTERVVKPIPRTNSLFYCKEFIYHTIQNGRQITGHRIQLPCLPQRTPNEWRRVKTRIVDLVDVILSSDAEIPKERLIFDMLVFRTKERFQPAPFNGPKPFLPLNATTTDLVRIGHNMLTQHSTVSELHRHEHHPHLFTDTQGGVLYITQTPDYQTVTHSTHFNTSAREFVDSLIKHPGTESHDIFTIVRQLCEIQTQIRADLTTPRNRDVIINYRVNIAPYTPPLPITWYDDIAAILLNHSTLFPNASVRGRENRVYIDDTNRMSIQFYEINSLSFGMCFIRHVGDPNHVFDAESRVYSAASTPTGSDSESD